MSRLRYSVSAVFCALALAACGSPAPLPVEAHAPGTTDASVRVRFCRPGGIPRDALFSEDPELLRPLAFGEPVCERIPGPRSLRVRLPIENTSRHEQRLVLQLEFLDERRAFYGDRTTRRVVVLAPGETRCFEATSAREKAESFVVVLTRP